MQEGTVCPRNSKHVMLLDILCLMHILVSARRSFQKSLNIIFAVYVVRYVSHIHIKILAFWFSFETGVASMLQANSLCFVSLVVNSQETKALTFNPGYIRSKMKSNLTCKIYMFVTFIFFVSFSGQLSANYSVGFSDRLDYRCLHYFDCPHCRGK